jgi:hypothetical protein
MRRKSYFEETACAICAAWPLSSTSGILLLSSHREAPMISNDPLGRQYRSIRPFRSPQNPGKGDLSRFFFVF